MLLKNAILELEITDMDYEGLGISHYDNYTVFVRNALVGEIVKARVEKVSKTIAFAKAIAMLEVGFSAVASILLVPLAER